MSARIAFGELQGESVRLTDLRGEPIETGSFEALMVSRLDCDLKRIELPPVAPSEVEGLLRFRVRALYPGNPENVAIDHVLKRSRGAASAVVAIMDPGVLRAYREAAGRARLVLMSTVLPTLLPGASLKTCVHWTENYAEVIRFEEDQFVESVLVKRTHAGGDYARLLRFLGEEARDVRIFATMREIEWIERHREQGYLNGTPVEIAPTERLRLARRKVEPLFLSRRASRAASPVALRTALAVLIVILAGGLFVKRVLFVEREVAAYRAVVAGSELKGARTVQLTQKYAELTKQLAALEARTPVDTYRFLADLASGLGPEVRVSDLVLQGRSFQFQATGPDALAAMERLESSPRFKAVTLLQTTPVPGTGREQFVVSGSYEP